MVVRATSAKTFVVSLCVVEAALSVNGSFPWNNASLSVDERVDALLSALTIAEKIGQMGYNSPAVTRLGIPKWTWRSNGLHGIAWEGRATVFPATIGLAATFDQSVATELGAVTAREARAKYYQGVPNSALSLYGPNINIFRDPRWGRGQETFGEDPVLSGELGAALIKSAQEPFVNSSAPPLLMCAKHYAVYNVESNYAPPLNGTDGQYRLKFFANVTEQDLEHTYLVPFEYAVKAGVASVMSSYNAVNGLPMMANGPLLDRLRGELGFNGTIITDCGAVGFAVSPMQWTSSHSNASAQSVLAGTNINCGGEFQAHLQEALDAKLLPASLLDARLRVALSARVRVGAFDLQDPYRDWYESQGVDAIIDTPKNRHSSLQAARRSMVLLRNAAVGNTSAPLLPLAKTSNVAVVGPNANLSTALLSNYAGCRSKAGGLVDTSCKLVNVLEGITGASQAKVSFAQGVEIDSSDSSGIASAVQLAADADAVVIVLGLSTCQESGPMCQEAEAHDRHHIGLPGLQAKLLHAIVAVNPRTILVLLNGGGISGSFYSSVPAVLEAFYPGALGGTAVAEVLFGDYSPAGRLPYTIVQSESDLPYPYYSMTMSDAPGRTYRYFSGEPGFAFGYGLSYTRFRYQGLAAKLDVASGDITVTGEVLNIGKVASDEVITCYVKSADASIAVSGAPDLGLVGFTRLYNIEYGAKRAFTVVVRGRALAVAGVAAHGRVKQLHVGGRAPGASPGAWADAVEGLPDAPIPVLVTLAKLFV